MISPYHAGYVVDASVLVKWFLHQPEADRMRALALREHHLSGRSAIFVLQLSLVEIINALRSSTKGKEEDGELAIEALRDLHLEVRPIDFDLLRKANAIAWAYKVNVHDAAHVALAEQLGYPFITADEVLIRKLKGHSIVVPLRELDFKSARSSPPFE